MSENRCIVSVGIGKWYPSGISRLKASLAHANWTGGVLTWVDDYPPGSPSHEQCNRGFKPWAIKAALDQGYSTVLWVDASIVFHEDPTPMFEYIESNGYLLVSSYNKVGRYSSDKSLEVFGVTRDEAKQIPDLATGFVGVCSSNENGMTFLNEWLRYSTEHPEAWNGSKRNYFCEVAADRSVEGHRHDQTVASLIAYKIGLQVVMPNKWYIVTNYLRVDIPRGITND